MRGSKWFEEDETITKRVKRIQEDEDFITRNNSKSYWDKQEKLA